MSNTRTFTFRLHRIKDKAVFEEIVSQEKAGFDLRKQVSDRFSRYLGVRPEMFHKESRNLSASEIRDAMEEALNPFELKLSEIDDKIDGQSEQLLIILEDHKENLRQLLLKVGTGGMSLDAALEELDQTVDDYGAMLLQSQEGRYD